MGYPPNTFGIGFGLWTVRYKLLVSVTDVTDAEARFALSRITLWEPDPTCPPPLNTHSLSLHFGSVMSIVMRLLYVDVCTWALVVRAGTGGNCGGGRRSNGSQRCGFSSTGAAVSLRVRRERSDLTCGAGLEKSGRTHQILHEDVA
jgi:hypothetical protein